MSTSPSIEVGTGEGASPEAANGKPLLVCLPSMPTEAAAAVLETISATFAAQPVLIASPDLSAEQPSGQGMPAILPYSEPRQDGDWVLTGRDYLAAARLAEERGAGAVLLLGTDPESLRPEAMQAMQAALAGGADLALPRYRTSAAEGLVNGSLLYPLTRALFGADIRFPLPLDAGLSLRMLARLAANAHRVGSQSEDALVWPVSEASVAGFTVRQVEGGARALPRPQEADLNELFPTVTGSLFADVESKAAYWQRARVLPTRAAMPQRTLSVAPEGEAAEEIRSLVDNFRVAFNNLRDIWSLVIPPQSLLALKKLSVSAPDSFNFAPGLWARTVYDFALAFHLRTLNRGHLLGALTPLYLGWVASFLRVSESDEQAGAGVLELTAMAYEQEKSYLVSRWRWPDRFNP